MKIDSEWMKGRSGAVGDATRSYRTSVPQNHSGMPITAWRYSKPPDVRVESVSADFVFGRNDAPKADVISIDVSAVTSNTKVRKDKNGFHVAMRPILVVAQCFAMFPITGIGSPDSSYLKFTWKSPKIIYLVISLTGAGVLTVCSIIRILVTGITAQKTTNVVFFGAACVTTLVFLRLAKKWPCFVQHWEKAENEMSASTLASKRINLRTRLTTIFGITMCVALVEHLLSIVSGYASACECAYLRGDDNIVATYFESQFPQVFDLTSYTLWKGAMVQCVNILSTFSWNFMDVFLMLVSSSLAERFRQMNERLYSIKGKGMPNWWWAETREDYNRLANLTRHVDSCVSDAVLLSFGINLYFICIQLLNSLNQSNSGSFFRPRRGIIQTIYTCFSFGFLLVRTAAVSLYAADVNDQSLRPSPILYSVSAASYSTEVQRFLTQTTTDKIGLTGLNFFAVTRGLILTVAGTIVTYELVLVQFNAMQTVDAEKANLTDACEVK